MVNKPKILVVGLGYVGLSNALLLAKFNKVIGFDLAENRIKMLNNRRSPINENDVKKLIETTSAVFLAADELQLRATDADYILICTPTNFDPVTNTFDTSSIVSTLAAIKSCQTKASIIIRSTIPLGFIDDCKQKFEIDDIFFVPEFLREGFSIQDNLCPSRIVIGSRTEKAKKFGELMLEFAETEHVQIYLMESREAECVKLFANTYLAARVSFFNELDSYCYANAIDAKAVINAISEDNRIGFGYNNPSFGYGGYCLPKDVQQLSHSMHEAPLIQSIHNSNQKRKKFIINAILHLNLRNIGIHRLSMKDGSDNLRESSIIDIITALAECGLNIIIYEPEIEWETFVNGFAVQSAEELYARSDIILANRSNKISKKHMDKVFSRDIYGEW